MKAIFISAILLLVGYSSINAQNLIAVQNNSTPSFYTSLDAAINNATDGDTLYLPGGSFGLGANVSKRLHIIGVGHNPDSTVATNPTYITGNICLIDGASGGSMTGIKATGTIYFGYGNDSSAHNYTIFRCNISSIISIQQGFSRPIKTPQNNQSSKFKD